MRRRPDRGELTPVHLFPIVLLLFAMILVLTGIHGTIRSVRGDLRRIADAVSVYAPPAVPAEPVEPREEKPNAE